MIKNTYITYQIEGLDDLNEWIHWDRRETPFKEVAIKNMKYLAGQPKTAKEFRLVKVETTITKEVVLSNSSEIKLDVL